MVPTNIIPELNQGNQKALRTIYKLYGRQLLFLSNQIIKNKQASEEIVNDVYLKVWDLRDKFETTNKLKAFLYIATKNSCYNFIKKASNKVSFEDVEDQFNLICKDHGVLEKIIRAELLGRILEEVAKLPEKQKEVFCLTYLEENSIEEICHKLGINANSVYVIKSRALSSLRKTLKMYDSDYIFPTIITIHYFLNTLNK